MLYINVYIIPLFKENHGNINVNTFFIQILLYNTQYKSNISSPIHFYGVAKLFTDRFAHARVSYHTGTRDSAAPHRGTSCHVAFQKCHQFRDFGSILVLKWFRSVFWWCKKTEVPTKTDPTKTSKKHQKNNGFPQCNVSFSSTFRILWVWYILTDPWMF